MAESKDDTTREEVIQQPEGLLSVFEDFDGLVYAIDPATHEIVYANRYGIARYGDLVGRICWQGLQEGRDGPCPECCGRGLSEGEGVPRENSVWESQNTKTGAWYQCSHRVIRWVDGRPVRLIIAVDITRLKETEEALRKSEEKYRSMFENAVEGMFQATPEGKYLSVNPAYAGMCGFDSPEEMIAAIDDIQTDLYVDPDDRNIIKLLYEQIGVVKNFETQLRRRDGQKIWISANARAVRDAQGNILFYEGTAKDVTERKLAVDALRQSERRFSIAFHESPTPTIISSVGDGRYVDVNRSFLNMLGYEREEIIGRAAFDLGIWAEPEARFRIVEKLQREGRLRDEPLRLKTKTGEIREVLTAARIIKLHGHNLILSLFQDMTERNRTEQRLRESEQRYRDFFRTSRDCVFISSPEGDWLDFNDAAIELFGFADRSELMRSKIQNLYEHPKQREELLLQIAHAGFIKDYPVTMRRKDGSVVETLITSVGCRDETGSLVQHQGTIRDVSRQRALERRLHQAHKMEAIGTLAGGIAHDFNNILGIIVGYTEMAMLELPDGSRPKEHLRQALDGILRAERLVKQIVAISRPVRQDRLPVNLAGVVRDSLRLLRTSLAESIEIREKLDSKASLLADPGEVQQLILNLCTNAVEAMTEGSGILEISLQDALVETPEALDYGDLRPGRYVRLMVKDTGPGIDPAIRDRIFDPYFTTRRSGEGSGLGLSIVHGTVMNYGGALRIDSAAGRGTAFDIYLPVVELELEQRESQVFRAVPDGSGRVLLVDDEFVLLDVGRQMLAHLGYEVLALSDPREALMAFVAQPGQFDVVITDMTMPQMTGVDLARRVMEVRPDMPVILCTGYSEHVDKERAQRLGIRGFMMKPCTLRMFGEMVHRVLRAQGQPVTENSGAGLSPETG